MKNAVFWDMKPSFYLTGSTLLLCYRAQSSGILARVDLIRVDVSEERITSIIRVTRNGKLGTMLEVNRNRNALLSVLPKRRFLQQSHGVTFQKTAFFTKQSNSFLECCYMKLTALTQAVVVITHNLFSVPNRW
jgi:hypothetical protein